MKKIFLTVLSLVLFGSFAYAETFQVKPEQSEIKWTAAKVTGKHYGKIPVASGSIEYADGKFTGGEAKVDTTKLTVEDLQGGGKEKLTAHLKSPDFFDVEKFPVAEIKITDVKFLEGNIYQVKADITIKNITQPAEFKALVEKTAEGIQASTQIKIDRTAYDIRYGSGKFLENLGDKTIDDQFTLDVVIAAA